MATVRKNNDERQVSRTYRAAIRIGEDFITLEETVTLPVDATDEDVAQAVALGLRIYQAQRDAIEAQIAGIRETAATPGPIQIREPDAPASDKQRYFITTLQDNLGWSSEQLTGYASDHGVDLVTLTKGQASTFIDGLKKLAEERTNYADGARPRTERAEAPRSDGAARAAGSDTTPINEKQLHALERLGQQRGLDLEAETRQRFGVAIADLTTDQASTLLRELQRPAARKPVGEALL